MNDIDKIFQAPKHLQADMTALRAGQEALEAGQTNLVARQQALEARQKALEAGQQALELKVEAIHNYQKHAHAEIMQHLIDSNEITGHEHKALEKRTERIEKHLDRF